MRALEEIGIATRNCRCFNCRAPVDKYTLSGVTWDCYFRAWIKRRLCRKCTMKQMKKLKAEYNETKRMEKKLYPERVLEKL